MSQAKRKTRLLKWGYGIVNADGETYMGEMCVCEDRIPMEDVASNINAGRGSEESKYRVVTLYRIAREGSNHERG